MIIPHHTNIASQRHWKQASFERTDPRRERLIEIAQNRGSSELEQTGGAVFGPVHGASVQSALATGKRYGFVGGSDTHRGTPGWPSHPGHPYYHCWKPLTGLTALTAPKLTREALWESLWNRRSYATTGPHILVDFKVNGQPMGSELPHQDVVQVEGFVAGTEEVEAVEVIKNGEVCYTVSCNGDRIVRLAHTDPDPVGYYYLRVRQRDGHHAWSSPVWIEPPLKTEFDKASPARPLPKLRKEPH